MKSRDIALTRYADRTAEMLARCQGKRVLHLGCVGFTDCTVSEKIASARNSLHYVLSQTADCVGVDIDEETVVQLRNAGVFTNIIVGNVEELEKLPPLPLFDVVVAGDIIEHISNPGRMLDGIKHLLKPEGYLMVSTPNSMGLPGFMRYVAGRFHEGNQHVLSFNLITLAQLLERHNYGLIETLSCYQTSATSGIFFRLGRAVLQRFPKVGGTLLFVARPAQR